VRVFLQVIAIAHVAVGESADITTDITAKITATSNLNTEPAPASTPRAKDVTSTLHLDPEIDVLIESLVSKKKIASSNQLWVYTNVYIIYT